MKYRSTRGLPSDEPVSFEDAVLTGLAPDGGLYVPDVDDPTSHTASTLPYLSHAEILSLAPLPFHALAFRLLRPFIATSPTDGGIPDADLQDILARSFATFTHPDVTPVVPVASDDVQGLHILELFHGPTFAFKDVALQVVGNLFDYFLNRRNAAAAAAGRPLTRLTVLGATSGDTGGAAIYGLRGRESVRAFILHPRGRVSPVQELQMTSVLDANIHNVAVAGATFDDCQDIVKALFADPAFRAKHNLAAINSINWARILAQTVYYFKAYLLLHSRHAAGKDEAIKVRFAVPTGNFGDVLAGYYAKRMGLPIESLLVATNENDILHRFFETGSYTKPVAAAAAPAASSSSSDAVKMTLSPAMDILVSSNFERVLWHFLAAGASGSADASSSAQPASAAIKSYMTQLSTTSGFTVPASLHAKARATFASHRASDAATLATIAKYHAATGYVLDPHTAVGVAAAEAVPSAAGTQFTVVLGTASPGKFPEAVWAAVGGEAVVAYEAFAPEGLVRLKGLPTRATVVTVEGVERDERKRSGVDGVKWVIEQTI
ncbi:tryptophan synthase beta subunit-like PLP-dependent enzyme [Zopfochytrium polystomum]|nr:tryptophan synthase beta subunit-like PLP-dependent enzyme [Zopfochytrium polystomum]